MVKIEVIYVPVAQNMVRIGLMVAPGSTVGDVLNQSGILETHPEVKGLAVGIFSEPVALDTPVKAGDRIEIYRPLLVDPKEKRRQRAKQS
jgi:uncharacterized protein